MMYLAICSALAIVSLGVAVFMLARMCWNYHQCMIAHADKLQDDLLHFTNAARSKVGAEIESQKLAVEERRLSVEEQRLSLNRERQPNRTPRELMPSRVIGATDMNGMPEV